MIAAVRPAAAQSVLPSSIGDWNASGPSAVAPVGGLSSLEPPGGSDPTILKEYFLKSTETRSYTHGAQVAPITLYRFRDPSSAYGAYTFLRSDSLVPGDLGSYSAVAGDRALIVVGDFLLDVAGKPSRPSNADLKKLVSAMDKVADHTPFPSIGEHLPEPGRVRGSERYVLGPRVLSQYVPLGTDDWIGFNYSAETMLARYRQSGKDVTLLISSYPTQQIAADKFAGMLRRFTFDPPDGVLPGQTVLFGKRSSSLIAVVVGAPSREAANQLLDQVQYVSEVTWNEPKHTLTDPSIGSIVVGAFLGTGVIMLLALAVGLGFGGIRVFLRFFLPNKVFDREKQIEILQLGIYSKPIQAKDFYEKSHGPVEN
ncbi:MAG: hypothetical protein JWN92_1209 [Candidatus Acidoferrum typicum]|nr:hypothetical protein [Candidatus Acidoferrum typicum]